MILRSVKSYQLDCRRIARVIGDKDVAYYGDRVTAKDVDKVLMRWKISKDEYRIIYGDLTAENVSTEQLAELETKLPE